MLGIILAIISGAAMSIQGVFNTRVSEKIGVWETNTIVQGSAFVLALLIMLMLRNGNYSELRDVYKRQTEITVIFIFRPPSFN